MNTVHRWFRSGDYSLLGNIDCAEQAASRIGALIVPPFGWEDACSYRPLRFLGSTIATSGIPVMRYDLPGTGDSSGSALDTGLLEAWIRSVDDAAGELRHSTGVDQVAVIGIRLGAMLAMLAASRGADIQDLVLWGAAASGRAMVRELRAFASIAYADYSHGDSLPEDATSGLEIGGFLISAETRKALESLDLSELPCMRGRRILLLSRDNLPADPKLIRALAAAGRSVETGLGNGYSAMMALPHEAVPPLATGRVIVEFLAKGTKPDPDFPKRFPGECNKAIIEKTISETICTIETPAGSMMGILTEPESTAPPAESCVVFLNSGGLRHTGPNRMWVEAARRWAARGVTSLRLDLNGIGESDGPHTLGTEELYRDEMIDQVEAAMDSLRSRIAVQRFALIGLCSGAFWAFHATVRRSDVSAAILLNQRLFFWDAEVDRRRLLKRTVKGLSQWNDWRRLARGDVKLERLKQAVRTVRDGIHQAGRHRPLQIPPQAMERAWAAIDQTRMTLVFTENEPLLQEMEEEGQMPPETCSRVRCIRLPNGGHTFRPLWAQQLAHEVIDGELEELLREGRPDFSCVSSVR